MDDLCLKLFNNLDDGIVIIHIENKKIYSVLYANEAFKDLIGKNDLEKSDIKLFELFSDIDDKIEKLLENINVLNPLIRTIVYIPSTQKYFSVKGVYIADNVTGISFGDIIDNDSIDEKLKIDNIRLEETTRNLEATRKKLVEEDKLASIGQLSAGIAHEINNPLGFVLSNFETLKKYMDRFKNTILSYRQITEQIVNSEYHEYSDFKKSMSGVEDKKSLNFIMEDLNELFNDTEDGLERVRKIVLALRNFARQEQDGIFDAYDFNAGIETSLLIAKNEIKYNAEVELHLGEIPLIQANSGQINQVILNIIVNSSHGIKEKNLGKLGKIKITTYSDNSYVYCVIEDNGIGISKENIDNVFKPFFTTKAIGIGTGLGLSISYDIIKNKHGGDINIESEKNQYTIVNIKLPISYC